MSQHENRLTHNCMCVYAVYVWLSWSEGGGVTGKLLSLSPLQSVIRNTLLPSLDIRFSLAVTQRTSTPESNSSIMQIINISE